MQRTVLRYYRNDPPQRNSIDTLCLQFENKRFILQAEECWSPLPYWWFSATGVGRQSLQPWKIPYRFCTINTVACFVEAFAFGNLTSCGQQRRKSLTKEQNDANYLASSEINCKAVAIPALKFRVQSLQRWCLEFHETSTRHRVWTRFLKIENVFLPYYENKTNSCITI